jgi:hypothetical protein
MSYAIKLFIIIFILSFSIPFSQNKSSSNSFANRSRTPVDLIISKYDWPWNKTALKLSFVYDFTGDGIPDIFMMANGDSCAVVAYIDDFGVAAYYPCGYDSLGTPISGRASHTFLDAMNGIAYLVIFDMNGVSGVSLWSVNLNIDPNEAQLVGELNEYLIPYAVDGSGNIWASNLFLEDYDIAVSEDGGETFNIVTHVGENDPSFWGNAASWEGILSANGNKISMFVAVERSGSLALLGLGEKGTSNPDSASGIYHWFSIDRGMNWQGEWIALDGDTLITNRRNYETTLSTWPFNSYFVDKNGVTHYVHQAFNTYTIVEGGSILLNVSPIVYWNDRDKEWIALERQIVETYPYDYTNLCAGNFNGPSLPVIETDSSGNIVIVMWNLPQFSGEPGNSPINIFSQGGEQNKYYYDIYFAGSEDGGKNWIEPSLLVNVPYEANYWVNISGIAYYDKNENSVDINYIYYYDEIPGAAMLGENSFGTNCTWKYNVLTPGIIYVHDENISAVDFNLMQNYPNPFNPSTVISYQLPVSSDVTLKVYDIIGKKIATLVNEYTLAGKYEVEFNASTLPSGVYFYQLKAGSYVSTKKMILLK